MPFQPAGAEARRLATPPVGPWHAVSGVSSSPPAYATLLPDVPLNAISDQFLDWDGSIAFEVQRVADMPAGLGMPLDENRPAHAIMPASDRVRRYRNAEPAVSTGIDARDRDGLITLDGALRSNQLEIADALCASGATGTLSKAELGALLIPAIKSGLFNLIRYALKAGADVETLDDVGCMPLHHAVLDLHNPFVASLATPRSIAHADGCRNTALHLAAIFGNPPAIKVLLERQASLQVRNLTGDSPLSCAAAGPSVNAVMLLLRAGADTATQNGVGQSPLHIACLHGHTDIVRMLLAYGADPNASTAHGETALAIAWRKNIPAMASALILSGATH